MDEPSQHNAYLTAHVNLLLDSYQRLTGRHLLDANLAGAAAAKAIFYAPFVVVSHNTADDPVFNYANQTALELFEMTWSDFTALASRQSAEAPNQDERARLLAEVTANGFIDNYSGIRISRTGRKFFIQQATVWNLVDAHGNDYGQAATFSHWRYL